MQRLVTCNLLEEISGTAILTDIGIEAAMRFRGDEAQLFLELQQLRRRVRIAECGRVAISSENDPTPRLVDTAFQSNKCPRSPASSDTQSHTTLTLSLKRLSSALELGFCFVVIDCIVSSNPTCHDLSLTRPL
jgi:hypothetical protein